MDFAAPASGAHYYAPYGGAMAPDDDRFSPATSRSTSPATSCPSPTSSVGSLAPPPATVAALAEQLGRQSIHAAPAGAAPRSRPPDRRRTERLGAGYADTLRSRRHGHGRPPHDAPRRAPVGSLVERMLAAGPAASRPTSAHSAASSSARSAAGSFGSSYGSSAGTASSSASDLELDVPLSPSAQHGLHALDPLALVDAALQGHRRAAAAAGTRAARRRPNAVQKEVRMRKRPKFRPR